MQERQLADLRARLEEQGRRRERELEEARREVQEAHSTLSQHREAWASRERELEERLVLQAAELDREKVRSGVWRGGWCGGGAGGVQPQP